MLGALSRVYPNGEDGFKCVKGLTNPSEPSSLDLDLLELLGAELGAMDTQRQQITFVDVEREGRQLVVLVFGSGGHGVSTRWGQG